jgi:hypothetical protein
VIAAVGVAMPMRWMSEVGMSKSCHRLNTDETRIEKQISTAKYAKEAKGNCLFGIVRVFRVVCG